MRHFLIVISVNVIFIFKLESWQSQNFLVNSNSEERGGEGPSSAEWRISLTSLRDGSMLQLKYESGTMTIATPHMSIAADIIQSLAQFFNLTTIQVTWHFLCL